MSKSRLIAQVAKDTGLSKAAVGKIIDRFIDRALGGLLGEGRLQIGKLGVFRVAQRAERDGHNPRTGQKLTIGAHQTIHYRPSHFLRNRVNSPEAAGDGAQASGLAGADAEEAPDGKRAAGGKEASGGKASPGGKAPRG
ncbi:MAG: HU family DNA-binding protein [Deltaproteobacteria bacterium]|jgi:DNA-binding protein HU-beta|nr:HU family DNA-binding protein [Deltaproteobacteria bacterium]